MLRDQLQIQLQAAVDRLIAEDFLPREGLPPVEVADPKDPGHGDFACSFALAASKAAGKPPREIAERLAGEVAGRGSRVAREEPSLIDSAEVAGPGFINLKLKPEALAAYVSTILDLGVDGLKSASANPKSEIRNPQSLNIEYVSVNPNGPITVGSGRGAAFGSTLANVLEAAGHPVHREYYINDGTNSEQMRLFAESVRYYLALKVFGEYRDSTAVESWTPDMLALVNDWAKAFTPSSDSSEDLYSSFIGRAQSLMQSSSDEHLRALASVALENGVRHADWYPLERAKQLAEYLRECWKGGVFKPVVDRFPESGYRGDYVLLCAREFVAGQSNAIDGRDFFDHALEHLWDGNVAWFQTESQRRMIERQRADLESFFTTFDTWFSEQSLHDSGAVAACIEELRAKGAADEAPYQTQIKHKKGEPDVIERVSQEQADLSDVEEGEAGDPHPPAPSPSRGLQGEGEAGATLWLRSTKFGDDKDRVLRRKDGRLTYIASDVAYHKDKFNRGSKPDAEGRCQPADKLITILGPDHHGYIGRLTAVVGALLEEVRGMSDHSDPSGLSDSEQKIFLSPAERDACLAALEEAKKKLEVVIFQIVRFVKDGKPAPMRKRDGNIYSLRDLMLEIGRNAAPKADEAEQMRIGKDVARFFYLMRSHDSHMDFDLDLAEKQSDENPVYYVQYAHARICSVIAKAREAGIEANVEFGMSNVENGENGENCESGGNGESGENWGGGSRGSEQFSPSLPLSQLSLGLLTHPKEFALIKKILDLPHEVRRCADDYGVHRLTTYAMDLARAYHHFYDACRVIQPEQPELSRARLALCHAARIGLRAVFELLGISAPERMDREPDQGMDAAQDLPSGAS